MSASAAVGAAVQAAQGWAAGFVSVQPGDYDPSSGHGPEWGKAAPAGLLIWLFLGTALFFLVKSMNRHIKRVSKTFGDEGAGRSAGSGGAVDSGGTGAGDHEETDMTLSSTGADPARPGPE